MGKFTPSDHVLGHLKSGEIVVDRADSHVVTHAQILPFLREALGKIDSRGKNTICKMVCFKRVIGISICVTTRPDDTIVYAKRPNREERYMRFVKNRKGTPCKVATVRLHKVDESRYLLVTAYIGSTVPPPPDSPNATNQSAEFWATHALLFEAEDIIPETVTNTCPW